jgi:hypothetical protein
LAAAFTSSVTTIFPPARSRISGAGWYPLPRRRENPGVGHVACAVADERDDLAADRTALFLERENIRKNLAGMLVVSEGVNGRNAGEAGEILHIRLRERANDRAVHHAAQYARGVLDVLAAAELNVVRVEKHHLAS